MSELRIGTSGWSYPSGPGTWNGIFYPAATGGRARRFDELAYYAEHFDTVEVNSSFYRLPDPAVTRTWARRTPPGFDFSLKLFQKFTHPAMHERGSRSGAPPDASIPPVPAVTLADVDAFKAAVGPLADAGKLGALLAQFPPSFRDSDDTRRYLAWLLDAFKGYPVAVELRHASWSDHAAQTLSLLTGRGAAWTQIDEPKFRSSIRQNLLPNLRGLYYMRLHGRNAGQWWTHDHPDERYNYLYSAAELGGIGDTIASVRRLVQKMYIYLNNHFAAKAVANAAALRHAAGQAAPGPYEPEMLRRYAFLTGYVTAADGPADTGLLFEESDDQPGGEGSAGGAGSLEN
jgi:uncharacterized protein YecE (DUF72 family)